jgi:anti-sigma regulatory factor (Ser/Thr protein kinase)
MRAAQTSTSAPNAAAPNAAALTTAALTAAALAPAASWRLRTRLELAALPTAVPCARGHVRSVALEWGLAGLADTAELLASELVTNAVQASGSPRTGPTPVVRLGLASDGVSLAIHVWDGCDRLPVRDDADFEAERGRGLMLVATMSQEWGSYRLPGGGKIVWVLVGAVNEP